MKFDAVEFLESLCWPSMTDFTALVHGALESLIQTGDLTGLLALTDRLDEAGDTRARRLRIRLKSWVTSLEGAKLWPVWRMTHKEADEMQARRKLKKYVLRLMTVSDSGELPPADLSYAVLQANIREPV